MRKAPTFPMQFAVLTIAEVGLLSFIAASTLFLLLLFRTVKKYRTPRSADTDRTILEPLSLAFLFALFMDSIQALGSVFNFWWAFQGHTGTNVTYCAVQGYLQQVGNIGSAWATILIAVITFCQLVFPRHWAVKDPSVAQKFTIVAMCCILLFITVTILPATFLYPVECGIISIDWLKYWPYEYSYTVMYFCFWLALAISTVLYGYIVIQSLRVSTQDQALIRNRKAAIWLLWYPLVYIIEVLPFSLMNTLPTRVTKGVFISYMVTAIIFGATGAINVLAWNITGRQFGFERLKEANVASTVEVTAGNIEMG